LRVEAREDFKVGGGKKRSLMNVWEFLDLEESGKEEN
jgi:hypothetical protein